ncbi:hypothetical protein MKX01_002468 [Papaver californicum]|nr:hypothetical protein MKX01_002468 [Papaver californicum]
MALSTGIRNIFQKFLGCPSVRIDKRYEALLQKLDYIQEEHSKRIGNKTDPEAMLVTNECYKIIDVCGEIVDRFETIEQQLAELEAVKSQQRGA